jgi:hypothetical protein
MGLCSGAYASFHGGLQLRELPIAGSILVNPLRFYWDKDSVLGDIYEGPVAKDQQQHFQHLNTWQYYMGAIRDVRRWKSLLTGRANAGEVAHALAQRIKRAVGEIVERLTPIETLAGPKADRLARDLRRFVESGRRLTFVFARSDPGYALLVTPAGPVVRRYLKRGKIDLWFIERADHTFTSRVPRGQFLQSVIDHVVRVCGH